MQSSKSTLPSSTSMFVMRMFAKEQENVDVAKKLQSLPSFLSQQLTPPTELPSFLGQQLTPPTEGEFDVAQEVVSEGEVLAQELRELEEQGEVKLAQALQELKEEGEVKLAQSLQELFLEQVQFSNAHVEDALAELEKKELTSLNEQLRADCIRFSHECFLFSHQVEEQRHEILEITQKCEMQEHQLEEQRHQLEQLHNENATLHLLMQEHQQGSKAVVSEPQRSPVGFEASPKIRSTVMSPTERLAAHRARRSS